MDPAPAFGPGGFVRRWLTSGTRAIPGRVPTLVFGLWAPLILLSLLDGTFAPGEVDKPLVWDPVPHVRLLVAVPLLLFEEGLIFRYLGDVVAYLSRSQLVRGGERPAFDTALAKLTRRFDSTRVDVTAAASAVGLTILLYSVGAGNLDSWALPRGPGSVPGPAAWFYLATGAPVFVFLALRWLWRAIVWVRFLWSLARMKLDLNPIHPDRCGGLGVLVTGTLGFTPALIALSAMSSASIADRVIWSSLTLVGAIPSVMAFIVANLCLLVGPLLPFTRQLIAAKRQGLIDHADLADDLFGAFRDKWVGKPSEEQKQLLGGTDPSSLSDYGYCYEVVADMRPILIDRGRIVWLAGAMLVPFLPLVFVQYSPAQILEWIRGVLF